MRLSLTDSNGNDGLNRANFATRHLCVSIESVTCVRLSPIKVECVLRNARFSLNLHARFVCGVAIGLRRHHQADQLAMGGELLQPSSYVSRGPRHGCSNHSL